MIDNEFHRKTGFFFLPGLSLYSFFCVSGFKFHISGFVVMDYGMGLTICFLRFPLTSLQI